MLAREYNRKQLEHDVEKAFTRNEIEQIRKAFKAFDKKDKRKIKSKYLKDFFGLLELELSMQECVNIVNNINLMFENFKWNFIQIKLIRILLNLILSIKLFNKNIEIFYFILCKLSVFKEISMRQIRQIDKIYFI